MLTGRVKNSDFSFIIDKINSHLAGWEGKLLSRAGRVDSCKFGGCLYLCIPCRTCGFPKGICNRIDTTLRRCVWGGNACHWVNWRTSTLPRAQGGQNIRATRKDTISLLGKHVWESQQNTSKVVTFLMLA